MIESEDYHAYIANLRAIGCPEPTLRDIIYADVSERFVRKRQAWLEAMERQFWDFLASDKTQRGDDEWQMKYDALKEEKEKTALEAIEQETERAIEENFGVSGLKTYKRDGGGWLDAMAELPDDDNSIEEIDRRK